MYMLSNLCFYLQFRQVLISALSFFKGGAMKAIHIQDNNLMVANHSVIAKVRNPAKKDNRTVNLLQKVQHWLSRRKHRRHLLELPDHLLKDIGLTRHQVISEYQKPFWKEGIY